VQLGTLIYLSTVPNKCCISEIHKILYQRDCCHAVSLKFSLSVLNWCLRCRFSWQPTVMHFQFTLSLLVPLFQLQLVVTTNVPLCERGPFMFVPKTDLRTYIIYSGHRSASSLHACWCCVDGASFVTGLVSGEKGPIRCYICRGKPNILTTTLSRISWYTSTILRLPRRLHHMKCYLINRINNFICKSNNILIHYMRKNYIILRCGIPVV